MADILFRLNVNASPEAVFDAIATVEGIRHWWTDDSTCEPRVGGVEGDRRQRQARSTAKGREGELLSTDVKELYDIKVANLQRERILHQLLHQKGYYLYHSQKRISISVAYPFRDQRLQAAYELYCTIFNQKRVRVPIDRDEEWLLLFTWNERGPPLPGDSNDALSPLKNHM